MSGDSSVIRGTCHCGAVKAEMRLTAPADGIVLRRCPCSFCRRTGALAYSDPDGRAHLTARADDLTIYQFGEGACDFLLCRICGVFVAAVSGDAETQRCVLNIAGLDPDLAQDCASVPLEAAGEDRSGRKQRHASRWTPITFSDPRIPHRLKTLTPPLQAAGSV